jgi:hypothetical protein
VIINAYATHRTPPALEFPRARAIRRDHSDAALGSHLSEFMGFVTQRGTRPMTPMLYGVLRHLERVRHHFMFEIDAVQAPAAAQWAQAANAILVHRDGTVRAPDGKVLVDPVTGDYEPGAQLPYPADAVARKATTTAQLAERDIRIAPHLPPCVSEVEVELREPRDVAARVLALFVCAVRAESLALGDAIAVETMRERMPLAFTALTPTEAAFMGSAAPAKQETIDHAWRYEAIVPLAWSLGIVDSVPFPTAICDVPTLAQTILALKGDEFLASARFRTISEILDLLDVTFRLHWATTAARVRQSVVPEIAEGAVAERHHALNWLVRFGNVDWDEVETPT